MVQNAKPETAPVRFRTATHYCIGQSTISQCYEGSYK